MTINDISSIMAQGNYFAFHKDLAKKLGLDEAIILGALINRYQYYFEHGKLDEEGMFYCTVETLENDTTLSDYKQRKALTNLQDGNFINIKLKGLPAKRYIEINADKIIETLRKF